MTVCQLSSARARLLIGSANWWDYARDLLFLINQKQDQMPQPLIGIGHSMGASQLYVRRTRLEAMYD